MGLDRGLLSDLGSTRNSRNLFTYGFVQDRYDARVPRVGSGQDKGSRTCWPGKHQQWGIGCRESRSYPEFESVACNRFQWSQNATKLPRHVRSFLGNILG